MFERLHFHDVFLVKKGNQPLLRKWKKDFITWTLALSDYIRKCLFIYLFIYLSIYLFIYLSIYLFIYLFILLIYLFIHFIYRPLQF